MLALIISYATLIARVIVFLIGAGISSTMVITRYSHSLSEQFAVYFASAALMILSIYYANEAWIRKQKVVSNLKA